MAEHRVADVRWADPGIQTRVQMSCVCGEWVVEFRPGQIPGEPLPLDLALEEFRAHRAKEMNDDS